MMIFLPGRRGCVRQTFGGLQNFKLRLGDVVAVLVHPGQRIIALRSAEINQHARRLFLGSGKTLGRINHFWQRFDGALEFR